MIIDGHAHVCGLYGTEEVILNEDILKKSLDIVGSKRIILGSDCPYRIDNIEVNIGRLKKINMSQPDMSNILSENILRILRI